MAKTNEQFATMLTRSMNAAGYSGPAQRRLEVARRELVGRQRELHRIRSRKYYYPSVYLKAAVFDFYVALDRVWECQQMMRSK